MFKLSIWFLQRWLKKRQKCDETVFVISANDWIFAKGWTFDDKQNGVLEE